MARRKKPENESDNETQVRRAKDSIADNASRSEKVSWDRKMDHMVRLMAKLRPLEDKILALQAQKTPILDEIAILREDMVRECIHPFTNLTDKDGKIHCKFCGHAFVVANHGQAEV